MFAFRADVRFIRQLLLAVAAAFIAMSLRTRRFVLLVVGVIGGLAAWPGLRKTFSSVVLRSLPSSQGMALP